MKPVVIGVGGPVGSGKTLLIERLTRAMNNEYSCAVITNDIYTKEDASMNFEALEELKNRFNDLDIIFLESGGDNLAATFSPDLVDFSIYIIDVAQGEKIPRKAGQGMIKSDLFIINKIDLAPYVGANLDIMRKDTLAFRDENSFIFTNLKTDEGIQSVISWIKKNCLLEGIA